MANEAPVIEKPSLINEPPKADPALQEPADKLYPEKKAEGEPAKEPEKKEPEPKKEEPKTEPEKKEEPKQEEPKAPAAEGAKPPIDYESLKLPEGSLLPQEQLAALKKEAKEHGLTLEDAQGVLEVKNDAVSSFVSWQKQQITKAQEVWADAWKKDPEYGGEKLNESTELAKRAWDFVADSELKTLADQAGFGNHPAVLRAFARLGKRLFAEDNFVRGSVGREQKGQDPWDRMYKNGSKNEET
jgi:hypothetical protein